MTPAVAAEILDIISRIGVVTVCALVVFGFLTERIVPRGRMAELQKELEESRTRHDAALAKVEDELKRISGSVELLARLRDK